MGTKRRIVRRWRGPIPSARRRSCHCIPTISSRARIRTANTRSASRQASLSSCSQALMFRLVFHLLDVRMIGRSIDTSRSAELSTQSVERSTPMFLQANRKKWFAINLRAAL